MIVTWGYGAGWRDRVIKWSGNGFAAVVTQTAVTPATASWYQRPVPRRLKPVEEDEALVIHLIL